MADTPLRVLLAEDDEDDFLLTRAYLKDIRQPQFEIDWASTYEAAAEQIVQKAHDLYLFDYRLGANSGLDLLKFARSRGHVAPVIMLTGHTGDDLDIEAVRAGAADYLVKGQFGAQLLGRSIRYSIERKRIETALRLSEERYRDLLENANDMVLTYDAAGNLTAVNGATEHITGYSRSELAGRNLADLLTRASMGKLQEISALQLAGKRTPAFEVSFRTKSGDMVYIELNSRPVGDRTEKVEFQAIGRDITDRKASEEKLRQYADEIERKNSELAAALAALRNRWVERRFA